MTKAIGISPLHDNIVTKPYLTEAVSAGGIIIPDSFRERLSRAKVIAVGPKLTEKDGVKVGDDVLTIKGSGTLINHEKEDYLIMRYPDILAVLN
jgi:chaperonin GroES